MQRLLFLLLLVARPSSVPAQRATAFQAIDAAIEDGIRRGIYPAAVVMVGRRDSLLYQKGYGHFTWSSRTTRPDPASTLWDIASLSKVVATASTVAKLVERGTLDLEAPVERYLPEFRGVTKDQVTVRMLLDHTSGLPPYEALYRGHPTISAAREKLLTVPLARMPGVSALYSDLNAMLAAMVVERVAGEPFDSVSRQEVFEPLGMRTTLWSPPAADQTRAVPTAKFRGRAISGVVNDENARILGGVAGHAGVFSTGADLARFARSWLRALDDAAAPSPWLNTATALRFTERSLASGTRALGWDTPILNPGDGKPPLYGRCATATTFGHTGWTGTLIWIDPAADLFVVLLTNRSYDPRSATKSFDQIREIRATVSDAARRAVGKAC
jgi:CubicO group peptidase (beta-lactamase class C family)